MRFVFPSLDDNDNHELSFEVTREHVLFSIDDVTEDHSYSEIKITHDEARSLIKYLEDKLPKN